MTAATFKRLELYINGEPEDELEPVSRPVQARNELLVRYRWIGRGKLNMISLVCQPKILLHGSIPIYYCGVTFQYKFLPVYLGSAQHPKYQDL